MKYFQKSFTLLELLVVITIIGILSSIVIVSMSGSTDSATIAKGKAYAQQVHALLGANAVGVWNFDEGTGTTLTDISGYGNNGIINRGANGTGLEWFNSDIEGFVLMYDGVDDRVDLTNKYTFTADHTIGMWININNFIEGKQLGLFHNSSYCCQSYLGIGGTGGQSVTTLISGETDTNADAISIYHSSTPFVVENWYHIVIIQDNNKNWYLYINGQYMGTDTTADSNLTFNQIGHGYSNSECYFPGLIDEVRIYSEALPATEIQEHYVQGLNKLLANQVITQAEYDQRMEEFNQYLVSI